MPIRVPPPKHWAGALNLPLRWFRTQRGARDVDNDVGGRAPPGEEGRIQVREPNGTHEITKVQLVSHFKMSIPQCWLKSTRFYMLLYVQVSHLLPCPFTSLTLSLPCPFTSLTFTPLSPLLCSLPDLQVTVKDRCQAHQGFSVLEVHSTICSSATQFACLLSY